MESKREAKPLLIKYFPPSLVREGGQGDRLLDNLDYFCFTRGIRRVYNLEPLI
jgi:hypothetical protein